MTAATLSGRARRDVDNAVEWIAADNPVAAQGLLNAVLRAAERIGEHPLTGVRRPDLTASARYRFVALTGYPYLIVYAADRDGTFTVEEVRAGAQAIIDASKG